MAERTNSARWRATASVCLFCFVALNIGLLPLKSYFAQLHRQNLMQADHSQAGVNEVPRHDWSTGSEPEKYWRYIPDARKFRLVVLDGMSQQFDVNDGQPGDRITSEILDDTLQSTGTRVFGIAAPNLNHEELLFHVHALSQNPATTPALLVFGVCFDKMRNVEVRPSFQQQLGSQAALSASWQRSAESFRAELPLLATQMQRTLTESHTQLATRRDQRLEAVVVRVLAKVIPVVGVRSDLRAIVLERVYLFRNWVFQIKTSSKRPILADRYALNQQALVAAVRYARARNVRVLLYVVPLNQGADPPYIAEEYAEFKRWLEATAQKEGAAFANLELAVPRESWGLLRGQPDFKHFKEAGHVATANALLPLVRAQLTDSAAR